MKKKMTLDVETLLVDSFDTAAQPSGRRGTVRGNLATDGCTQGLECQFTDWQSCVGGCSDSGCGPGQICTMH